MVSKMTRHHKQSPVNYGFVIMYKRNLVFRAFSTWALWIKDCKHCCKKIKRVNLDWDKKLKGNKCSTAVGYTENTHLIDFFPHTS